MRKPAWRPATRQAWRDRRPTYGVVDRLNRLRRLRDDEAPAVLEAYHVALPLVARAVRGYPSLHDDVVSLAGQAAVEAVATFRGGSLGGWTGTIALRTAADARLGRRRLNRESDTGDNPEHDHAEASADLAEVDARADLDTLTAPLGPRERSLIEARYAGYQSAEWARANGLSDPRTCALLAAARQQIGDR